VNLRVFFCLLALSVLVASAQAATRFSKTGNRSWNSNNDWTTACGNATNDSRPANGDDAVICQGTVMTINADTASVANLTINAAVGATAAGILRIGNNNTARTVTVTGNFTINTGGIFEVDSASDTTHFVVIGGNLTNNGTFDMATDSGSLAQSTFNTANSATISGTGGRTRFYRLIVSKGTSAANVLEYTADDFQFSATPVGCLLLANGATAIPSNSNCVGGLANTATNTATGGTFKISRTGAAIAVSPFDNATMANTPNCYLISSAAGFWLNDSVTTVNVGNATATCNSAAAPLNLSLNGATLRVSNGTLNLTTQPNQRVRLLNSATSKYWQEGGTVTISGRLTNVVETDSATFQMSGGTLILGASATGNSDASAVNGFFGPFFLGSGASSTFNMTGGTMIIRNPSSAATPAYAFVNGATLANSTITGGLVQIGDASTNATGQTFEICIGAEATSGGAPSCTSTGASPMWNLTVDYNKDPIASLNSALTVKNDLTVGNTANNSTARLNASTTSGQALTVNHDLILGIGSASGTAPRMDMNAAALTVDNNLTLNTNSTFNASTTSGSNVSVGNNVTIGTGATLVANDRSLSIGSANLAGANGVWTNNGAFTQGNGTVTFNGTGATQNQAIAGTTATTFNNLTINKTGGPPFRTVTINTSPTVNGTLTLTAGTITTGSNKISLAAAATTSRTGLTVSEASGGKHVVGNFEKGFNGANLSATFPVGDGTNYTPLTVAFTSLTTAGNLTATTGTAPADHLDTLAARTGVDSSKSVNRWWTLKGYPVAANLSAGGPVTSPGVYNLTLNYLSTDVDGGSSASNFKVARGESCTTSGGVRTCNPWGSLTVSGTPTTTQAASTGALLMVKDLEADFVVGEPVAPRFVRQKEFIYTRELY
jgi:hypothetical protein